MGKLIRVSILLATVVVPVLAARERDGRRGLRMAVRGMLAVTVLYWIAVMALLPNV